MDLFAREKVRSIHIHSGAHHTQQLGLVGAYFYPSLMRLYPSLLILILFLLSSCGGSDEPTPNPVPVGSEIEIPATGYVSPNSYPNLTLTWEEDFSGTSLNRNHWSFETGTGNNGWGNNELQYYREENTSLQEGHLVITAKKESVGSSQYTSSRLVTMGKKNFRYGRIDVRAALPRGQGLWPAIWMLGTNFSSVGWPASGEIDIMEMVGGNGRENTVHGTVHWQNQGQHAEFGGSKTRATGTYSDEFHVYSVIWTENQIRWLVNDEVYHTIDTSPAELDEFRKPFFFILNLAVGGNWPGSPSTSTSFPQHFIVDYIRVFQ